MGHKGPDRGPTRAAPPDVFRPEIGQKRRRQDRFAPSSCAKPPGGAHLDKDRARSLGRTEIFYFGSFGSLFPPAHKSGSRRISDRVPQQTQPPPCGKRDKGAPTLPSESSAHPGRSKETRRTPHRSADKKDQAARRTPRQGGTSYLLFHHKPGEMLKRTVVSFLTVGVKKTTGNLTLRQMMRHALAADSPPRTIVSTGAPFRRFPFFTFHDYPLSFLRVVLKNRISLSP